MKSSLLVILLLFTCSCRLTQHYSKYIDENQYGRLHLKDMEFKKSFTPEMYSKIEADAVYYNYYEDLSINYKLYSYIRFFKSGQFAIFTSKVEEFDLNDVQKAFIVGYYNVVDNVLLLEIPNTSFSKSGKKAIRKFEIEGSQIKEIIKKNETGKIYTKLTVREIKPVLPDW